MKKQTIRGKRRSGSRNNGESFTKRKSRTSKELTARLHAGLEKEEDFSKVTTVAVIDDDEDSDFEAEAEDMEDSADDEGLISSDDEEDEQMDSDDGHEEETHVAYSDSRSSGEDLLRLYFRDIGRIPLLSENEVIELAKKIERAQKKKDKATITKAKKKLVSANLRLVVSIAKKFSNCGMPLLDLIQAGNTGLMKAVDGFNYKLGFRFSTYASKWIQAAITRTISNQVRTVRIPVNVIPALRKVDRTNRKLSRELGRRPTTAEIASVSGVETEKVRSMARIPQRAISLDFPVDGDNSDCTLGEILGDTQSASTAEIVDKHFFREELESVMQDVLDEREQEVLRLRYGLIDGMEYTQSEIAKHLNLSRQRVSQIENKALLRMRHYSGSQSLRSFFN